MKEYKSDRLRNVGIVAHGGAGKTSLAEAVLFNSGATNRLGRVDDGSAICDFEPEEIKRKVTISASLAPCEWRDHKINFLDTPGYADFVSEVKGVLRAVDSALVVLCAASGIEVETEKVWQYAADLNLPRLAFINKMDRENADFYSVLNSMKEKFGTGVVPLQLPIGSQDSFKGIIDLVSMKAFIPSNALGTKFEETDIPADLLDKAEEYRMALIESAAEGDDDLLTKYLEGEELSDDEVKAGLAKGILDARLSPVFCGSAYKNIGVAQMMDALVSFLPAPIVKSFQGVQPDNKDVITRKPDNSFAAMVFKTTADPFVGRLSFLRILSGALKPDSTLYNSTREKSERIGSIFTMRGKQQDSLTIAHAGDIVVIPKMQETKSGDTLCDKESPIVFDNIQYPKPMFTLAVEPKRQ